MILGDKRQRSLIHALMAMAMSTSPRVEGGAVKVCGLFAPDRWVVLFLRARVRGEGVIFMFAVKFADKG